ncbi:formate dehydrogenase accessory sulfurtransferase FdhD [Bosea sp. (in: a-proteobacteria)]|uniref:formate dehydrogenase accessory sulfurtransferase FdhD n=1 Tax=Bosea sp. (in: a-proteobacteria) TaxID=1871050 RepID=UPI0027349985|nr:formate dehydrogenase accessory sulfurtransferase FdhD [Bosea sp. (in: a-proteobacteria)]MDP3411503.1 formate dehydrogenase accessory sulfurtransferase FdhD [Bosea sp. (in: a-proteobacteria)]
MMSDAARLEPAFLPVAATRWRYSAPSNLARDTEIAVEWPINIRYGSVPYAVMMATPLDLEDFVTGFSLTEGIIAGTNEIRRIDIVAEAEAITVEIDLSPDRFRKHLGRIRRLSGRTSCGVCGISDAADLPRSNAPVGSSHKAVSARAVARAVAHLRAHQPLHALTHSVHGAVWCDLDGTILDAREDVGRHNALDKLIGAVMRAERDVAAGFVVVTSRASYEMVEKTTTLGAAALVSVSAPTSLAVARAKAAGLILVSVAREDGCEVYAGSLDDGA